MIYIKHFLITVKDLRLNIDIMLINRGFRLFWDLNLVWQYHTICLIKLLQNMRLKWLNIIAIPLRNGNCSEKLHQNWNTQKTFNISKNALSYITTEERVWFVSIREPPSSDFTPSFFKTFNPIFTYFPFCIQSLINH